MNTPIQFIFTKYQKFASTYNLIDCILCKISRLNENIINEPTVKSTIAIFTKFLFVHHTSLNCKVMSRYLRLYVKFSHTAYC